MEEQFNEKSIISNKSLLLKFQGCSHFRLRLVCSILSGTPCKIEEVRAHSDSPGVKDFEASFLRLLEKITNGGEIRINETGTMVYFKPGIIVGGKISHDCGTSRGIGFFLEPLLWLAPFSKQPFDITLNGITNNELDISVDLLRTVTIPLISKFGLEDIELKIKKRGAPPKGGGQIYFKSSIVRSLKSIQLLDEGKIRRIRGIAYCTRISPQIANRMVDSARSILSQFQSDIFIYTDHYKGSDSGLSAGFALSLVAESTTGNSLSSESVGSGGTVPEDLGIKAANFLLAEIANGGCVDSIHQSTVLLFMVLCPETISKIRIGKLSPYTIETLRLIREVFGVTFKIEPDPDSKTLICTCRGIGYKNLAKKNY